MTMSTIEDLLVHELKDLYYVESKLTQMLDTLANDVHAPALKQRLHDHCAETDEQATRLEQAFRMLGVPPEAEPCPGFDGIKAEHDRFVKQEHPSPDVYDLYVAGAAGARIKNYEIAAYTSAIQLAERSGHQDVADLLSTTLLEEHDMLDDASSLAREVAVNGGSRGG